MLSLPHYFKTTFIKFVFHFALEFIIMAYICIVSKVFKEKSGYKLVPCLFYSHLFNPSTVLALSSFHDLFF